jgi:hypothetical protein
MAALVKCWLHLVWDHVMVLFGWVCSAPDLCTAQTEAGHLFMCVVYESWDVPRLSAAADSLGRLLCLALRWMLCLPALAGCLPSLMYTAVDHVPWVDWVVVVCLYPFRFPWLHVCVV